MQLFLMWCPFAYLLWTLAYSLLDISWVMVGSVRDEIEAWKKALRDERPLYFIPLATFWMIPKERNRSLLDGTMSNFDEFKDNWFQILSFFIKSHLLYSCQDLGNRRYNRHINLVYVLHTLGTCE